MDRITQLMARLADAGLTDFVTFPLLQSMAVNLAAEGRELTHWDFHDIARATIKDVADRAAWLETTILEMPAWKEVAIAEDLRPKLLEVLKIRLLQWAIDDEIALSKRDKIISCRKGCAHCCHYPVSLSDSEAYLLALAVKFGNVPINTEVMEAQQELRGVIAWAEASKQETRCMFLTKANTCSAYKLRPGSCRNYAVRSAPSLCNTDLHKRGNVTIVSVSQAELFASTQVTGVGIHLPHRVKAKLEGLDESDGQIFQAMLSFVKAMT